MSRSVANVSVLHVMFNIRSVFAVKDREIILTVRGIVILNTVKTKKC